MDGKWWKDEERFDFRPCGGCADLPAPQSMGSRKNLKKNKKPIDKQSKICYNKLSNERGAEYVYDL